MKHGDLKRKITKGIWCWVLFISLTLLIGIAASAGETPSCPDFVMISDGGFGDPQNNYAWSVSEFKGDVYVGTGRNIPYFVAQGMKAQGAFPENWTLSFLTTPGGSPPPPLVLPNHSPPSQADVITWSNGMRGEIWRYHEGAWSRAHQASTFVNPLNGYTYPEGIGYRAMTTFTDTNGTDALYAGVGFGFGRILIIKSTDGTTWVPVNTSSIPSRDTRAMISHNGKIYVGTGEGIYASGSPSPYTDNWVKVADFQTASLASFNGYLYAGTGNPIGPSETDGFEVWRSTAASPAGASDWVRVVTGGAGDAWNVLAATIQEYEGDLYVGSMNLPFGTGTEGVKGFDLIRLDSEDSWDLIVGNYQPRIPTDPRDPPLSGWPSGFGNPFNLYAWSIEEYNGNLYLGSFDIFSFARFIDEVPGGYEILIAAISSLESTGQGDEFSGELEELADYGNSSNIIPVIELLANNFGGADLWTSPDGVHWVPVDLNGFGDPNNYGFRTMQTTPEGIIVGTANPFAGCQVWLVSSWDENPPAGVTDLRSTTCEKDAITWTWTDPVSPDFSHVLVYLDGEFRKIVAKGTETYTATGLDPETAYSIGTKTVGKNGRINQTVVSDTAWTLPATHGWKFRSDLWNSGVYDDDGTRPEGTLLWNYTSENVVYSSPAVANGVVYVGSDDKNLYALDASTGALLWNYTTGRAVRSSPAVANGVVYVGSDDKNFYALDASTGALLWNFTTEITLMRSSPAVANGVVYIGDSACKVYALDAATGALLWNYTTVPPPYAVTFVTSSPAVANGIVYAGNYDDNLYALDAATGALLWNYTTGNYVFSSPAVANGVVYIGSWDGNLYALDASTGVFKWNYTTGNYVTSSPAVANGVVYIGSGDNNTYALDAATGALLWNYTTGNRVVSSPAVANGVVYIGSNDNNTYALDAGTGVLLWNYTTAAGVSSSPSVANGVVYVGSLDGNLYALGSSPGTANLMIGKSGPSFYENASVMNYTLSYRNQGTIAAENVVLKDYLPPSVEFLSGTGSPIHDGATRTVTWDLGSIPPYAIGTQSLTVRIPSSVPYDTVLSNTANITTATPESRDDDNSASALTTVTKEWIPPYVSISPSVPGSWGDVTVYWRDSVTFSYNQTLCSPDTPVDIRIHIDDGGPDIIAPMTGGPQYWNYTTTFYPRHGAATVTFGTPGCTLSAITFPVSIEAAGYIYDAPGGQRIQGANVWLQWPDDEGNWVNVPTDLASPPMEPDQNPLVTSAAGQYQWDVVEGSYRVYAEAQGYTPAASTMVNSPPQFSGLNLGLAPTTGKIWVSSTPTGAEIFLDGSDTGFVTSHELSGISAEQHTVVLKRAGYQDYNQTVTVIAGQTVTVHGTLSGISPVVNFTANETFGFIPMTVLFTDSSTGTQPLAYQWNFGDGTPNVTEQNPLHTYTSEGTYNVTLTVSNSAGTGTLERPGYINAWEPIIIGGDKGYYLVHSNVDAAEVYFNGDWYMGNIENGTLLLETCTSCTPVWTFTVKKCGYFPLTQNNTQYPGKDEIIDLYANLTAPKEPLIPDFSANITEASAPPLTVGFTSHSVGIVHTWNWSFGDGTYSEERNPVHTYTALGVYTVSLHETNSACQENTMVKEDFIRIAPKPPFYADFTVTPVSGSAPLTVQCTDKSNGNPTTIIYEFGDGSKAMGPNPTHVYRSPGTYTITETISKYDAATHSIIKSVAKKPDVITVFSSPIPILFAAFSASPVTGTAPLKVTFTDESWGNPTYYIYDFGDGFKAMGPNPTHTYRFPGIHTVSLKVLRVAGSMKSDVEVKPGLIVVTAT